MYVAARPPLYRLEHTHTHTRTQTTPSDLGDELLVDFEPSITADIFFPPPASPSLPLFGVLCLCVSAAFQSAPGCQLIVDNYSYLTAAFTASPFCRHLERENMPGRGP